MTRPLKLDRAGKLRLLEADVTEQCIDYLRAEGWDCKRQHVGKFIPISEKGKPDARVITIGEKGDPDWLVMQPTVGWVRPHTEVFYLELKAPGGRFQPGQKLRHAALQLDGWLVCVARGLDELQAWMEEQGL